MSRLGLQTVPCYQFCRFVPTDTKLLSVLRLDKNRWEWHYGFKLHAAIDHQNTLAAVVFTLANERLLLCVLAFCLLLVYAYDIVLK
jgi:hypothetical protein